jgi:ribosomal protein S18 acetylase RimI-like enzyme
MNGPLRLRPLRRDDTERIHEWITDYLTEHLRWWSESVTKEPWTEERIANHLKEHDLTGVHWRDLVRASEANDCFVKVACDANQAHGVVSAELRTDRYLRAPMGVVSWIYVEPSSRRQGIAERLLEAAEGWMSWKDVAGRELFVTAANEAAVAAYEKRGYGVVDFRMLAGPPTSQD